MSDNLYCCTCGERLPHDCSRRFCAVCGVKFIEGDDKYILIDTKYGFSKMAIHPGCLSVFNLHQLNADTSLKKLSEPIKAVLSRIYYNMWEAIASLREGRTLLVYDHEPGKAAWCFHSPGLEEKTRRESTFVAVLVDKMLQYQ